MRLWRAVGTVLPASRQDDVLVQVDVMSVGGMSGGAAFNSNGECFGILSSSIDHGGGAGTSRVHLLWPALSTNFPDQFLRLGTTTSLFDLQGVTIECRERVIVQNALPGVTTVRLILDRNLDPVYVRFPPKTDTGATELNRPSATTA